MRQASDSPTPDGRSAVGWCCASLVWLALTAGAESAWRSEPFGRSFPVVLRTNSPACLRLLPPGETGVTFANLLAVSRFTTNQILLNGSGVAAGDIDGDGWCDLYFCGLDSPNALYRNLGNWRFENIAAAGGVDCPRLDATGALLADLDGDADLDLVVNSVAGGTHLFLNDGQGRFSPPVVLNEGRGGMSLTAADIDGDSDLDLYVCNYRTDTLRDQPGTNFRVDMVQGNLVVTSVNGRPTTSPDLLGRYTVNAHKRIAEHGEPDVLYLNDGKANFASVSFASGLFLDEKGAPLKAPLFDWGLSAMFRDLNGDAAPDLYVCNDFDSDDRIWLNSGAGVFRAAPPLAFRNTCKFSMGVDVADINRDGWDDVFVLDMLSLDHVTRLTRADKAMGLTPLGSVEHRPQLGRNTLHLNRGDGTYAEIAFYSGLAASDWSWTPIFLDVDLDGFEDLIVTTGHARDDMDIDTGLRIERARRARKMPVLEELNMRRSSPALATPNLAFRNQGDLTFRQAPEWGFDQSGFAHGMCLADLDNDGDADLAVNNLNAPAAVYQNESGAPRLAVRLRGAPGNTRGVGARITVTGPNTPVQSQEVLAGGRYLSSDEPLRTFATGTDTGSLRIEVRWRSGRQSVVEQAAPNRVYEIDEALALASPPPPPQARKSDAIALFQDVSETLGHVHHETEFDDFARQPLLPDRLSQLGPGIAWIDLNADGVDELIVGAGKGGSLAIYERSGTGTFQRWNQAPFGTVPARDQTAVLPFWDNQGVGLLAGESSYEDGLLTGAAVRQFHANRQPVVDRVPAFASAVGPLALADLDGDGTLELFVGGRVVPGRYPEAATSMVYKWQATGWVKDEANSAALREVGLVSGAVCTDLNGDGYPELVLACEWGPVRVFANTQGRLADATRAWGLDEFRGWWNGIAAGDFDGDGRMDLIASNWGLNTKYRASRDRPRRLYYGQLGGPYAVDTLEAYFDPELKKWVPERDLESVGRAMPWVRERYRQHRAFAKAGIDEILGERLKDARVLEATWLETTVFLNRDGRFVQGKLPAAAQFSPAFGVNAADFDGDGAVDLFLSQNFFAVQPQCSRNDTGRGLLLKGDGTGAFIEMPNSGIAVYGEQRGSAAGDFDQDGREDLAVTQNGAATRLFRNVRARPGLTVRLKGPPGNPHGIGGVVRLAFGSDWGPARELRGGGGYWSHDSLAPVLAMPSVPTRIQARWPGGASTTAPLPAGAREILIDPHGTVQVIR